MSVSLSLLLGAWQPVQANNVVHAAIFEPTDCQFPLPPTETIRCGFVIVPERHDDPTSSLIKISVTIVKSHSPNPLPDPIIYINGGPGGASLGITERLVSLKIFALAGLLPLIQV
ncbi:MAG: hypothetical protein AAF485_28115 [Chloroflexota bacterium]